MALEIKYEPGFIAGATNLFDRLMEIDWVQRDNTPRKEYWDTAFGKSYTYGQGRGERTYEPNARLPELPAVRSDLKSALGFDFEGCFLNRYDSGSEGIGWHADDDPAIDHTRPIVVISLGSARDIQWKPIGSKGMDVICTRKLGHGSMFVMPAGMQHTHWHRIPKAPGVDETRISLTFRGLLEPKGS